MTNSLKYNTHEAFLLVKTPAVWVDYALEHLDILLVDHAHCEKKAASTAINLLFRYPSLPKLCHQMSRLAREELRHFEQVLSILEVRKIPFHSMEPSRYAGQFREMMATHEPQRLVDLLIVGAFIEARSCERFASLLPYLAKKDEELRGFYQRLVRSESRHFKSYLALAFEFAEEDIALRIDAFAKREAELITTPDPLFRFHSGVPIEEIAASPCEK